MKSSVSQRENLKESLSSRINQVKLDQDLKAQQMNQNSNNNRDEIMRVVIKKVQDL